MPELPDVEMFRRAAELHCLGREIAGATVSDPASVEGITVAALRHRLKGARLQGFRRHGKHLLIELDLPAVLTLHFGTNGSLRFLPKEEPEPAYARLRLDLAGGDRLAYLNPRRIGRVGLAPDAETFVAAAGLGPDALDPAFDAAAFAAALAGRRQAVKLVLTDQARMAGIGNIYADEILFQAGLFPGTEARSLDTGQVRHLFETMKRVLRSATNHGLGAEGAGAGAPAGWLLAERHRGGRCPRCGTPLHTATLGGRTGYFCPRCQPEVASVPASA
jgi:formamidopyrimidine-DNA glycosylase